MRVEFGVTQVGGYSSFKFLGDDVLQLFGIFVNLVPGIAQGFGQVALEQAMSANGLQGDLLAGRGQLHAAVALVVDQPRPGGGELLQHARDGCRRHCQLPGQGGGARHPRRRLPLQLVDCLQIVLNDR